MVKAIADSENENLYTRRGNSSNYSHGQEKVGFAEKKRRLGKP